jgi:hypothetical protein
MEALVLVCVKKEVVGAGKGVGWVSLCVLI